MKRLIPLMLVALLMLAPFAVAEGNQIMKLADGEYLRDLVTDGETLYAVCDNRLYACKPGDAEMTRWESGIRFPDTDGEGDPAHFFYEFTIFAGDGGLRGIRFQNDADGYPESLTLFDLAFTDHNTVEAENVRTLDAPAELKDMQWFYLAKGILSGGRLYLMGQTDDGCAMCVMDESDPKRGRVERMNSWDCDLLATPGGVLLADHDYAKDRLTLYRVGDDASTDELCALPLELQALAADPVTGAVYGAVDGNAVPVDIETGEVGEAVAVLPTQPQRGAALGGGRVYAVEVGANIALMDTEGQLSAGQTLVIRGAYPYNWVPNAVVDFSLIHPEITPTLKDEYLSSDEILNAMMTQSADVDIYVVDCEYSGAFQAVRDRGYMLPLDESEALSALAGRMYPRLRETCSKDGALVALPLNLNGHTMGVNGKLLEKLGLSIGDVPRDWLGFLNFMEDEIRPRIGGLDEKDHFTYDGMTAKYFARTLRYNALNDYVNAVAAAGGLPDYEDPDLVAVLERIDGMDFTAYGLPESEDDDYGYSWSSDVAYLILPEIDIGLDGNDGRDNIPLALSVGDSPEGVFALNGLAAFVNPFSAHREEALAFMELLAERMPENVSYMLFPDLSEPVRYPDYEATAKNYEAQVEQQRAAVENAAPKLRQEMEDQLAEMEKGYQDYVDNWSWMIRADKLAWYRGIADRVTIAVPSWFSQDSSGEAWQLLEQYMQGQMNAREFLAAVNRKARMMAMEG